MCLADGSVIHDSRVILDYLDQQQVGNPLIPPTGAARWRRLTLASTADGVMDAAVLMRYELGLRLGLHRLAPARFRLAQLQSAIGRLVCRGVQTRVDDRDPTPLINTAAYLPYIDAPGLPQHQIHAAL